MTLLRSVIVDTDGGIDDQIAVALLGKAKELHLLGISTVAGAVSAEAAAANVLRVLDMVNCTAPVFVGSPRPLLRSLRSTPDVHGEHGTGDVDWPASDRKPETTHAVQFLLEATRVHPGATLVTLGPLTNLALAVLLDPTLPQRVARVVSMGGAFSCAGNITPAAEGNIFKDPEAASICLDRGMRPVFVGLDVTTQVVLSRQQLENAAAGAFGEYITAVSRKYVAFHRQRHGIDGIHAHDPTAATYVIAPDLFAVQSARVDVELSGTRTLGATVWDRHGLWGLEDNAYVCVRIDADRVREVILNGLKA